MSPNGRYTHALLSLLPEHFSQVAGRGKEAITHYIKG